MARTQCVSFPSISELSLGLGLGFRLRVLSLEFRIEFLLYASPLLSSYSMRLLSLDFRVLLTSFRCGTVSYFACSPPFTISGVKWSILLQLMDDQDGRTNLGVFLDSALMEEISDDFKVRGSGLLGSGCGI